MAKISIHEMWLATIKAPGTLWLRSGLEFDAQCVKDTPRNIRLQAQAGRVGAEGNHEQHEKNSTAQDQEQTHKPEAA